LLAPHQTLFNIFEYHLFYRSSNNWIALKVSVGALTVLLNSGQFMLQVVFAGMGLLFVLGHSEWEEERKSEFYLCGLLAAGLGLFLISVRLTFTQYFILLVPFLSILASVGIIAAASWLRSPGRPALLVPGVLVLFVAGLPRWLYEQHNRLNWPQLAEVARAIDNVTPQDGLIWADEMIYFAAHRIPPPSSLGHFESRTLRISTSEFASLHIVPDAAWYDWITAGRIATVVTCWPADGRIDESDMRKFFREYATVHGCDIFWSKTAH
jgi:hypothetical protein